MMRSGTASLAASMFLGASLAQAVVREGDAPFADPGSPTARSAIYPDLFEPQLRRSGLWGAMERGGDCNDAWTADPVELDATYLFSGRGRPFRLGRSIDFFANDRFERDLFSWDDERQPSSADARDSSEEEGAYKVNLGFQLEPDPLKRGLNGPADRWTYLGLPRGIDYSFSDSDSRAYDEGFDADPRKGTSDDFGRFQIGLRNNYAQNGGPRLPRVDYRLSRYSIRSLNVEASADTLPDPLDLFHRNQLTIGERRFTTLKFKDRKLGLVYNTLQVTQFVFENNWCRVVLTPTDPNYTRTGRHGGGSWGQPMDDQWAIKRVGYTEDESSAWNQVPDTAAPVVVAVIDTGLDWHHLDISYENIWRNEDEIPDNGIDDDNNGFVDDIVGWDFLGRHNKPWDFDGHGTVVAGIIAARQNNGAGIAGINPHAKIMVLKGVNNFGSTRASYIAEAIVYAADNGARIINLSVGGPHTSRIEQAAIDYAHEKGVLVVAASGNEGIELEDYGPAGADHVLTVGATHTDDRAAGFSNFGDRVDLVAPGVDVLSLRARYTDANYRGNDAEYQIGTNYVGDDKRYLHVSGTSFSAPIVSGTASLLLARSPELTASQVENILVQTAEDIEFPGKDKYAGFGLLDARTALSVDPDFFVTAAIDGVKLVESDGRRRFEVTGTADAQVFKRAWMQIGAGENPGAWKSVGQKVKFPVRNGTLGRINFRAFSGSELWQVVVNVEHKNGTVKRAAFAVRLK